VKRRQANKMAAIFCSVKPHSY